MVPVGKRALVRGRVDAAGEAGDDDEPVLAELQCDVAGEAAAVGRRIARADDGDGVTR